MTPIFLNRIFQLMQANGFGSGTPCDCRPDCETINFEHHSGQLSLKINPLIPAINAVQNRTDQVFAAMIIEEQEIEPLKAFIDLLYTSHQFYNEHQECRVWRWGEILKKRKECGKMFKLLNYNPATGLTVEAEAFVLNKYSAQAEKFLTEAYAKQFPGTQTVVINSHTN